MTDEETALTTENVAHACREFDPDCIDCLRQRIKDQDEAIDELLDTEDRVKELLTYWRNEDMVVAGHEVGQKFADDLAEALTGEAE